jgi:hypothetical protein
MIPCGLGIYMLMQLWIFWSLWVELRLGPDSFTLRYPDGLGMQTVTGSRAGLSYVELDGGGLYLELGAQRVRVAGCPGSRVGEGNLLTKPELRWLRDRILAWRDDG